MNFEGSFAPFEARLFLHPLGPDCFPTLPSLLENRAHLNPGLKTSGCRESSPKRLFESALLGGESSNADRSSSAHS